ncbi:MAG: hypothetical protein ABSD74_04720 [Rhizomicrobium sp.]|jgi:hypothetical protein
MDDFDLFAEHLLQSEDNERLPVDFRDACVRDRQSLLRAESDTWYRSYLPQFEAIAAQLRREALQRNEDAQPHLRLARRFDELATNPEQAARSRDNDQGPY